MNMKFRHITIALASAVLSACGSCETDSDKLCIKEFVCQSELQTKTSLGSDNSIIWDSNDHIKVFSANCPEGDIFTDITLQDGGRKAIFKGMTEAADTYCAGYPAEHCGAFDPDDGTVSISIPSSQKATAGTFADNANPSVARTDGSELYFRNIGAILAVRCPTKYASSLKLCSRDRMMTGESVIMYDGDHPEVAEITGGENYAELTGLSESSFGKTFYMTAYPGDYNGFDIIITNYAKTHRSIISSEKALKLERNDNILLYDGEFVGWNAPMPPYGVTARTEKDRSVTVSWSCSSDASMCKGFRILARKSGNAPQTLKETGNSTTAMNLTGLEEGATYTIGVQSMGSRQRYDSEVIWSEDVYIPESGMYDWEKSRREIATFADLDLLPGGITDKQPGSWDESRMKPHVTFIDEDGKEQWLHEAFLFFGGEDSQAGSVFYIPDGQNRSADKESWKRFADWWLSGKGAASVLDQTISNAKARIGDPGFKHKVVMSMPDPIMLEYFYDKTSSTTYWGQIDGRQLDFSNTEDQILAYKWYIDHVRSCWNEAGFEHLELAGFYIISEILVAKSSGWNYKYKRWDKILPSVAGYLHDMKYGMYWIPYYKADGYDMTAKLGIDYTWLQPNKYWDYPEKKNRKSWTWVFNTMSTYGHGMEIEFEGSHGESGWSQYESGVERTSSSILETVRTDYDAQGTPKGSPNPHAARNKQLLREYMEEFKKAGYYGNARIATYSGTNAMYELATSPDSKDREMYLEYCEFITGNPLRNNN